MRFSFPLPTKDAFKCLARWAAELRGVDFLTIPDEDVYSEGDVLVYDSTSPSRFRRPEWRDFDPRFPTISTTTFTPTLVTSAKAIKFGRTVNIKGNITGTTGGVTSGFIYMALPHPAREILTEQIPLYIDDAGGVRTYADIFPDVNTLRILRNGAWGIGVGRVVRFSGFYEAGL